MLKRYNCSMLANIFRLLLAASGVMTVAAYLLYREPGWPYNVQSVQALLVLASIGLTALGFERFQQAKDDTRHLIRAGLWIGLLWTAEICYNNILHAGLPLRDRVDDAFWLLVATLVAVTAWKRGASLRHMVRRGLWIGAASGVVACTTALAFVVFALTAVTTDPLSQQEWASSRSLGHASQQAYFAYQTMAGAVLHLVVLGVVMGSLIGAIVYGVAKISGRPAARVSAGRS
jgi:hypothetical protein